MRYFILYTGFILVSTLVLQAQHISDDSVSYTPIPLPVQKSRLRNTQAQDSITVKKRPVYFFSLNVGSLFGCGDCIDAAGVSSTFSAVNGVAFKKLRAGISVGFDSYYGWNVLPLSGMISWDLWGNRNTNALFIQLNYGQSKAWIPNSFERYGLERTQGGRLIAPQFGYRIKYHDVNFTLLAGAKLQRVISHYRYPDWRWVNGVLLESTNNSKVEENMSRFMISLSVGWK